MSDRHDYHEMVAGPKHWPHIRQIQIGWLGQTGAFYPWPTEPTREEEPGSYGPIFIDEDEGPKLTQVGWGRDCGYGSDDAEVGWRLIPLRDGPDRGVDQPVYAWPYRPSGGSTTQ